MMTVRPFGALDPSAVPKPVDPTGQFDSMASGTWRIDDAKSLDELTYYVEVAYDECAYWSSQLASRKPDAAKLYDVAGTAFLDVYQSIQGGATPDLAALKAAAIGASQKLNAARVAGGIVEGNAAVIHESLIKSNLWLWVLGGVLATGAVAGGIYAYKHSKRKRAA